MGSKLLNITPRQSALRSFMVASESVIARSIEIMGQPLLTEHARIIVDLRFLTIVVWYRVSQIGSSRVERKEKEYYIIPARSSYLEEIRFQLVS
jgi:hypothetical protein